MDVIFYTKYRRHISIETTRVKPLSVIRTDSYLEIPYCEITLSNDYKKLVQMAGFISFTDDDKLYQITDIETRITSETQYVFKAYEVFSSILSRRITAEDRMFSGVSYEYPQELTQALKTLMKTLQPPLSTGSQTEYGAIEYDTTADTEHAKTECVWETGTSLFDYLQKEAKAHNMYIDFRSRIERVGFSYRIEASATLRSYNERDKIFLPSPVIEKITIAEPLYPEYTEVTFDETMHTGGSYYNARYQGILMTDYYNPNAPAFDDNIRDVVINAKQIKGDTNVLSSLNLNSLTRYVNNSASNLTTSAVSWISGGRYYREVADSYEYIYMYPNTLLTVQSTITGEETQVRGLTLACASDTTLEAVRFRYHLLPNGTMAGYTRTRMNGGKADGEKTLINGRYFYVIDIFCTDTDTGAYNPISPAFICVSKILQNDKKETAIENVDYVFPIALIAVEQKLLDNYPKTEKDITVEFAEDTDFKLGDKIQAIADNTLFNGTVTAVTETWENGTYKRDIETTEWTMEN